MPERVDKPSSDELATFAAVGGGLAMFVGVILVVLAAGGWFWKERGEEHVRKVHAERSNAAAMSEMHALAQSRLHNGGRKTPAGMLNVSIDRAMEIVAKELK